jgi:hypothetical protein
LNLSYLVGISYLCFPIKAHDTLLSESQISSEQVFRFWGFAFLLAALPRNSVSVAPMTTMHVHPHSGFGGGGMK